MHFYLIFANLQRSPSYFFEKEDYLGWSSEFPRVKLAFRLTLSIRKSLSSPFFFTLLQQQRQRLICLFFPFPFSEKK